MPGKKYASLQHPSMYEALKAKGFSKRSAARISNAKTAGHKVRNTKKRRSSLRDALRKAKGRK